MHGDLFQMGLSADFVNAGKPHGRISGGQCGDQDEERHTSRLQFRRREYLMPQRRFEQTVGRGLKKGQGQAVPRRRCPDAGDGPGLSHDATVTPGVTAAVTPISFSDGTW